GAIVIVLRYLTGTPSFSAGTNSHALTALRSIESCTLRGAPTSFTDSTLPTGEMTSSMSRRSIRLTVGGSSRGSCGRSATGALTPSVAAEKIGMDSSSSRFRTAPKRTTIVSRFGSSAGINGVADSRSNALNGALFGTDAVSGAGEGDGNARAARPADASEWAGAAVSGAAGLAA